MSDAIVTRAAHLVDAGLASINEACEFLGIGRTHIYRLMGNGDLPYAKIQSSRRIPWNALKEYAARHLVGVSPDEELVLR